MSIKYERMKYELKTHKIGIIYKNAIKKGIKGAKTDIEFTYCLPSKASEHTSWNCLERIK